MNTDNAEPPDGAGAGAGNASLARSKFVGLNVPLTICVSSGNDPGASSSSSVKVTFVIGWLPPTSDIMIPVCPDGLTNIMSMSSGLVWLTPIRSTVTFVIVPVNSGADTLTNPDAPMLDG